MDFFSNAWRLRSSLKTPVFSNFFLKRFNALSNDSPSFTLIMIIIPVYLLSWDGKVKYLVLNLEMFVGIVEFNLIQLIQLNATLLSKSQSSVSHLSPHRWCIIWHHGRIFPQGNLWCSRNRRIFV